MRRNRPRRSSLQCSPKPRGCNPWACGTTRTALFGSQVEFRGAANREANAARTVAVDDLHHHDVAPLLELRVDLILRGSQGAVRIVLVHLLSVDPNLAAIVAAKQKLRALLGRAVDIDQEVVGHA